MYGKHGDKIIFGTKRVVPSVSSIPSKTDAGTYYVWYKAVGDANHNDSQAASVTVTISSPEPEPTPEKIDISKAKVTVKEHVYTGKKLTPKVTVKLDGKTLKLGTDYTVTYKNNKKVGKATAIVKGKGDYTGTARKKFRIIPKKVKEPSVTVGKKKITVEWKVDKKNDYDGYQIKISTKKNFKNANRYTVKSIKKTSRSFSSLKKGKTYYVRIRTWKKVGGKRFYSEWSKTFKVKIK